MGAPGYNCTREMLRRGSAGLSGRHRQNLRGSGSAGVSQSPAIGRESLRYQ